MKIQPNQQMNAQKAGGAQCAAKAGGQQQQNAVGQSQPTNANFKGIQLPPGGLAR